MAVQEFLSAATVWCVYIKTLNKLLFVLFC